MKKLNRTQVIGIGIVIIGITTSFLVDNDLLDTTSGVLTAIGIGFIFKWIPFKKRNLSQFAKLKVYQTFTIRNEN